MLTAKHRNDPASHLDALLDEALEETFPASDPIAISVAPEACRLEQSTSVELRTAHTPQQECS
jgi:hypothetical protein